MANTLIIEFTQFVIWTNAYFNEKKQRFHM